MCDCFGHWIYNHDDVKQKTWSLYGDLVLLEWDHVVGIPTEDLSNVATKLPKLNNVHSFDERTTTSTQWFF